MDEVKKGEILALAKEKVYLMRRMLEIDDLVSNIVTPLIDAKDYDSLLELFDELRELDYDSDTMFNIFLTLEEANL